jgi:AbrB family looped-hinge helix DNA binding protein
LQNGRFRYRAIRDGDMSKRAAVEPDSGRQSLRWIGRAVVETATLKKVGNSYSMAIVKVKEKFQVTLPAKLRKRTGVEVGDFLEARVERGKITLTPKSLVDRRLAEALEDVRRERVYGPFDGHPPMVKSLHSNVRKRGVKKKIS